MRATVALLLSLLSFNVFAAGRPIASRPIVPAPYPLASGATAFAAGRFLSVWIYDTRGAGTHIVGVFSDGEGRRISPAWFPILTPARPTSVRLIAGGDDSWILFWYTEPTLLYMTEVDADGRVTRHVRTEVSAPSNSPIVRNGTQFMLLSPGLQQSRAIIFDRDGRLLRNEPIAPAYHLRAAPSGDGFLTFAASWGGLYAQHISVAGEPSQQWKLDDGSNTTSGSIPTRVIAEAAPGGDVLVVWAKGRFGTAPDLKSAVFRDGAPMASRVLLESSDTLPQHLTSIGDGFRLLGTTAGQLAMMFLDRDGVPQSASFTPIPGARDGAIASSDRMTLVLATAPAGYSTTYVTTTTIPREGDSHTEIVSLAPARQADPVISAADGNFVAAWTESSATASSIRTAFLAPWGETLSTATVLDNAVLDTRRLAWNGSEMLLLARRGDRLLGMRLSRTGLPVEDEPFALGDVDSLRPSTSAVTWTRDRWIVAWSHYGRLFTAEVSASGAAGPARELIIDSNLPDGWMQWRNSISLAFNGRDVVIVWNEQQEKINTSSLPVIGNRDVHTYIFAARLTDAEATVVARDAYHTAAASNGADYLVVAGGTTVVVRSDGAMLRADAPRMLSSHAFGMSDVVWDGGEYIVATRYGVFAQYLAIHRLDRDGVPSASARYTRVLLQDLSRHVPPSIAAERWTSPIVALHEVSAPGDTQQALSILESELQPLVEPPAAPRATATPKASGLEVTWEGVAGDVEGYIVESRSRDGDFVAAAVVRASVRSAVVERAVAVRVRAFNAGGLSEPSPEISLERRRSARH